VALLAVTYRFAVEGEWGPDGIELAQDLHKLPPRIGKAVVAALGARLDVCLHDLEKAVQPKGDQPDPMAPELFVLLQRARRDFRKHGTRLVAELVKLMDAGRLLPMDENNEALLRELFADHEVGIVAEFAGRHHDTDRLRRLVLEGLVRPDYAETAAIPLSYRLGKGLQALKPVQVATNQAPALRAVVRKALDVDLSPDDKVALRHVQQRGAEYMRVQVARGQANVLRRLTDEEKRRVRGATAAAIRDNKGARELEQDLKDAAVGTQMTNDMERVARTELHFAKGQAAFEKLRNEADNIGDDDPLVARQTDGRACKHCRRIFGVGRDIKPYRMSEVEANTLAGGNFGRKAEDWVAVIGPVHPKCRCPPYHIWSPGLAEDVQDLADLVESMLG
jgi:hypothetical protein